MAEITATQQERLSRLWDSFERAGMLREAVVNGASRVRVRWDREPAPGFGAVEATRPSVKVLEHEYPGDARQGDVLDIGEERYTVIGEAPGRPGEVVLLLAVEALA